MRIIAAIVVASSILPACAADCRQAIQRHIVCDIAVTSTVDAMRARNLEAITVMQDVTIGSLLLFAASDPAKFDVSAEILPLSLSKLILAASWWDRHQPDTTGPEDKRIDLRALISSGSDSAGKQVAVTLRNTVGNAAVRADIDRYGFGKLSSFWRTLDPQWKSRLKSAPINPLDDALDDEEWGAALSLGETHFTTTALHLSRFLQAVGNHGIACTPVARRLPGRAGIACTEPRRVLEAHTSQKLIDAMLGTVRKGTAKRIVGSLSDIGWSIGGKPALKSVRDSL